MAEPKRIYEKLLGNMKNWGNGQLSKADGNYFDREVLPKRQKSVLYCSGKNGEQLEPGQAVFGFRLGGEKGQYYLGKNGGFSA